MSELISVCPSAFLLTGNAHDDAAFPGLGAGPGRALVQRSGSRTAENAVALLFFRDQIHTVCLNLRNVEVAHLAVAELAEFVAAAGQHRAVL